VAGGAVGIEAVNAYCGSAWVPAADLFAARGLDPARLPGLGLAGKGVALPDEDVVALAATAARPLVTDGIRTLVVATESGVDLSKSVATHVHALLDLPRRCRLFEVKQACYGGVAALQTAAALVAAEPGGKALVVAADLPVATRGEYIEASQGAGAVAVLVGDEPRVAALPPGTSGCYGYDLADFRRPRPDLEIVDTDLSLMSYLDCLLGSFADHADRVPGTSFASTFDLLAMHTPFPGMVRGAHRTALRKLTDLPRDAVAADFERRVAPSLVLPALAGNIYSGTTLLAVLSAIAHAPARHDRVLGVFSYGSGCASEFLRCEVPGGAVVTAPDLAGRRRLSVAEYDAFGDRTALLGQGARDVPVAVAGDRPGRAVLTGISGYHREYAWL
jgi:polyketide biosynthesis 3-hydroxy-3-methylglutaryl-CoA synthase-like enzyme PksG